MWEINLHIYYKLWENQEFKESIYVRKNITGLNWKDTAAGLTQAKMQVDPWISVNNGLYVM